MPLPETKIISITISLLKLNDLFMSFNKLGWNYLFPYEL